MFNFGFYLILRLLKFTGSSQALNIFISFIYSGLALAFIYYVILLNLQGLRKL